MNVETKTYSKKVLSRKDFEGAPKGAFEIASAIALYAKYGRKPSELELNKLYKGISNLCQELKDIDSYIIKMTLLIYKKEVARKNIAYHPKFFINFAKKMARHITPNKRGKRQQLKDFKIPDVI